MEIRIEPYSDASPLPDGCQACLYWEHPRIFAARPEVERARAIKREWMNRRAGVTAWGLIAYVDSSPVGYCLLTKPQTLKLVSEYGCGDASADSLFVACLCVIPSMQRKGIGRRLLAAAEAEAARLGYRAVETMARIGSADNPSGPAPFWLQGGYEVVKDHDGFALVRRQLA